MRQGCQVTNLSGSPSPADLVQALQSLEPNALCLGVTTRDNLERAQPHLEALASQWEGRASWRTSPPCLA